MWAKRIGAILLAAILIGGAVLLRRAVTGGSDSPTGRIPHERSRVPTQVAGSTAIVSPSASIDHDQVPTWANRHASSVMRPFWRQTCRGSSTAGNEPSQVRSKPRPLSAASHTIRIFSSGSTTSIRYGPTF